MALFCCGHSPDNVFFDHYREVATLWASLVNQDTPPIHATDDLSWGFVNILPLSMILQIPPYSSFFV